MNDDFERHAHILNALIADYQAGRSPASHVITSSDNDDLNGPECQRLLGVTHLLAQVCAGTIINDPNLGSALFGALMEDLTAHMRDCFHRMALATPEKIMEFAEETAGLEMEPEAEEDEEAPPPKQYYH